MSELILYTTEDGRSQIKLRAEQQTVWLTQLEMAELFDATKQNISLHLKNLFQDGELDPAATVKESLTVQTEGAPKWSARSRSTTSMPSSPWAIGRAQRAVSSSAAERPWCSRNTYSTASRWMRTV